MKRIPQLNLNFKRNSVLKSFDICTDHFLCNHAVHFVCKRYTGIIYNSVNQSCYILAIRKNSIVYQALTIFLEIKLKIGTLSKHCLNRSWTTPIEFIKLNIESCWPCQLWQFNLTIVLPITVTIRNTFEINVYIGVQIGFLWSSKII